MGSRVWGIDIGSTGIKVVELSRSLRGERVTNYGFFPVQGGERLQKLREISSKIGEGADGLILPIASHRTMVHRVPLPFRDRKKNLRVVKFEAESNLPYPIDQVVVDFTSPERDTKGKANLVFAMRKEDLREEILLLKEAGLDPESVIPEAMALFWVAKKAGKASEGTGALLDLGQEKTTLIVWSEGDLALVRSIPIAGAAVRRRLEKSLRIPPEEASSLMVKGGYSPEGQKAVAETLGHLAEEVQRTLLSYEYGPDGRPVENIFLTGGSALLPGVEKALGERLKKPVAILNLEESLPSFFRDVPKELHHLLPVAMGATLWEASPERMNFRQEEFASSEKAKKVKTRLKILISYAAVLAVLGVVAFSLNLYLQEKRYGDLKTEIRKEFLQAQPGIKKVVSEIQQMRALVREEKARLDALGGTSAAGSPLEIIRELSLMQEPAWKVRLTELIVDPETVEVNGEANSFDAVNQLKAKLDRSSLYREVQLKTARASSLENVIEFKLQMKRRT